MLLAVDTSTRWTGLALYNGVYVLGEMIWQSQNTHTVEVAPAIQELLKRAGAKTADLRAVGVAIGPGSFTSLRIGLSLATGIALAWYRVQSGAWVAEAAPVVVSVEELAAQIHRPTLVCGELTGEERQHLARKRKNVVLVSPAQSVRRPAYLAELAWRRWQSGKVDDPVSISPIYLHIAEAIPG